MTNVSHMIQLPLPYSQANETNRVAAGAQQQGTPRNPQGVVPGARGGSVTSQGQGWIQGQ